MVFVADSMVGRLATWLRVLGYDTRCVRGSGPERLAGVLEAEARLITRHRATAETQDGAVFIRSDRVGEQLAELGRILPLRPDPSRWFTRCLRCNTVLREVSPEDVSDNVPDYILYHAPTAIRTCPSCGRYFWPGSHRTGMLNRLRSWGFAEPGPVNRKGVIDRGT